MLRILSACCMAAILFSSCTNVVADNFPGKAENAIPSAWQGRYVLKLPAVLSSLERKDKNDQVIKQYVIIDKNKIIWDHSPEVGVYSLSDSLVISTVDSEKYISLKNGEDNYYVFQVKEKENGLTLTAMYSEKEASKSDLVPYFNDIKTFDKEDKEPGAGSGYRVTIVDKKLKDYFKSPLGKKTPVELIRQ